MNTYFVLFLIVAQIMTAEFLFTRTFSRRKLFYLRFLGYGVVTLVASFWIQALYVLLSGRTMYTAHPRRSSAIHSSICSFISQFSL